ncbi:hypothetical protein NCS56_01504400 [Fusarium sp. Ph1]|nr:hypothetical protein NCS56_01504400 [Fusarium sp. Ph1]
MENTRYKSNPLSYILNPEPSQDHSPRQAGPTASSCSTDGLPRHHDRLTSGDAIIGLALELDYSKEASAMVQDQHSGHPVTALSAIAQSIEGEVGPRAAKPDSSGRSAQPNESRRRLELHQVIQLATPVLAIADPRSFTAGFGITLGEEEEAMGSPIPSYSDEIQFPGPRASWPCRYGSSIYVSNDPSEHLLNDSLMADPPETGLFDEEDAGSCTTLAGEEDRRSLTPAPASGRPFRRAHKQEFKGKGTSTRNTREQQDISEPTATLEMEDVDQDQDQGRGENAIFPVIDWLQLQPNFSIESTAQGDGLAQRTRVVSISLGTMPPSNVSATTFHSLIVT